jgi:hypothetical protein
MAEFGFDDEYSSLLPPLCGKYLRTVRRNPNQRLLFQPQMEQKALLRRTPRHYLSVPALLFEQQVPMILLKIKISDRAPAIQAIKTKTGQIRKPLINRFSETVLLKEVRFC